jgi:hypothetical protein
VDSVVTEAFYSSYQAVTNSEARVIDAVIRRLLVDSLSGWARQGRIEGDIGSAWIVSAATQSKDVRLYWDYSDDENLVLLALVLR